MVMMMNASDVLMLLLLFCPFCIINDLFVIGEHCVYGASADGQKIDLACAARPENQLYI